MRRALYGNIDLILTGLGAVTGFTSAVAAAGPLRVVLGGALCLLLPGYALSAALYPKVDDLGWSERIALSVGGSLVLLILIALALSYSPWAHDPQSTAFALGGVSILSALAAWLRRTGDRSETACSEKDGWATLSALRSIIAALAAIAVLVVGLSSFDRPMPSEAFTAFSARSSDGASGPYVLSGGRMPIILGVSNHEGHQLSYRVEVRRDSSIIAVMHATVASGATWRRRVSIAAPSGKPARFQMLLFRRDRPHHVYRLLRLRPTRR